ncbi:hypothetical protein [Legionella worsleiensis]|uniref:Uncharacterized protein n=1 Tax=Legionella worsleiensis TaxID=45076 RepID=A0A0W1AEF7_9GAMM|nr:hypothetical protein [Legionella worsleiensis]KTD79706.1 hypothetical protein Lwor_1220 [Legionella worsleiensis]STY32217.1 Uncharacterised protein [Legionella worsleiensis]
MGFPKKALRESDLTELTAGPAVEGSHIITRVTFKENGVDKLAFFKRLEPHNHYPSLLAKIDVATSCLKMLFQGEYTAEERLVLDKDQKIVGTVSLAIDGFTSFNFYNDPIPTDPVLKEQVIPGTRTLLDIFFIVIAFASWFLDNDDFHAHNGGIARGRAVDLDFDMYFYWFTIFMKEARPGIGVPKTRINLSVRDWETFPKVVDSKAYHWPTYAHPGQETAPKVLPSQFFQTVLPKQYADPAQFAQLAHEPEAHEQKFVIAMKALLTYQPEVVRNRLFEYFGDMKLDYTDLDETDVNLRACYEENFPTLCNEETNKMLFVDFMMLLYQKHYDNLYKVVVFYMGCENNGHGVALDATYATLYNKPSIYKNIAAWMQEQNETVYKNDDVSIKYDLNELQHRYHQIWRDAYAPTVKKLLHDTFCLTIELLGIVSAAPPKLLEIEGKNTSDESLTSAWELFGAMPDLSQEVVEPKINVDKENPLRLAMQLLVNFAQELQRIVKTYYMKERCKLTEQDNLDFCRELLRLHTHYHGILLQALMITTSNATKFNLIASKLDQLAKYMNFQIHLVTIDEMINDFNRVITDKKISHHTDEEEIKKFNEALFLWAKNTKPDELSEYIIEIIDKYYSPTVESLSSRHRSIPVKKFLEASKNQSGDNRLAYILSSGREEVGALNSLLIQHLTPIMLQTQPLPSISQAIRDGTFNNDIATFTLAAVNFAKCDSRLRHLYHPDGIGLFYSTLFDWVNTLPNDRFNTIVEKAILEYEAGLSSINFWRSGSRRSEVKKYCESFGHAKAVALTFIRGSDSSTMNTCLFDRLINELKGDISRSVEMQNMLGCKLIAQYEPEDHKERIFSYVKKYSTEPSHNQDRRSYAASSSSSYCV